MDSIFDEVRKERERQIDMYGVQEHSKEFWLTILMEEVGEVAREIWNLRSAENNPMYSKLIKVANDHYREELIQVVAVGVAMLQAHDLNQLTNTENVIENKQLTLDMK